MRCVAICALAFVVETRSIQMMNENFNTTKKHRFSSLCLMLLLLLLLPYNSALMHYLPALLWNNSSPLLLLSVLSTITGQWLVALVILLVLLLLCKMKHSNVIKRLLFSHGVEADLLIAYLFTPEVKNSFFILSKENLKYY
ncbi:hypothetical protein T4B_11249 [Trichinella pseudospiralis]|uniref:Uncharacterized protein n=1 Tax=Trichinella pseudospiralis TaxID=6337 RepID=A0A0V1IWP6_TRIPS|nr:hypothetical protein T4B_11249 [Trichinella pseudospiralis]